MSKPLRDLFGEALVEAGKRNADVVALDADLASTTRSAAFMDAFPDRFFNVGVAESNMVSIAAGLSSCGKIPFACTFSFLLALRTADQIRSLVCYPFLNVKLVGVNAGLSGYSDGATHQCVLDVAVMRALPGMTVIVPSDGPQLRQAVLKAAEQEGPLFLRVPRVSAPQVHDERADFNIGEGLILRTGSDLTIVANGLMVAQALEAADRLSLEGIDAEVIEIHTVKPLHEELIAESVAKTGAVVAVEEHSRYGGLCSAVAEVTGKFIPVPFEYVAIEDRFGESGLYEEILQAVGLTVENIVRKSRLVLKRKST